jgi:hypothetical protein
VHIYPVVLAVFGCKGGNIVYTLRAKNEPVYDFGAMK